MIEYAVRNNNLGLLVFLTETASELIWRKSGSNNYFTIHKKNGTKELFSVEKIYFCLKRLVYGIEKSISIELVMQELVKNLYDQASTADIEDALILSALVFIEQDAAYSTLAARLLRQKLAREVFQSSLDDAQYKIKYEKYIY